jgi:hypothetical protein
MAESNGRYFMGAIYCKKEMGGGRGGGRSEEEVGINISNLTYATPTVYSIALHHIELQ